MSKYLLIFEDGAINTTTTIDQVDKNNSDDGYLSIIDISDPNDVKEYYAGGWQGLAEKDVI